MAFRLFAILGLFFLASCDGLNETASKLNPLNLFGSPEPEAEGAETGGVDAFELEQPDDGKTDIQRILSARLEYTPSGVIVRANGEAPTIGYHSASLRPVNFGKPDATGAVRYEFRVLPPRSSQPEGSALARSISVGSFIPNSRLRQISTVTVSGAENEITIRLR